MLAVKILLDIKTGIKKNIYIYILTFLAGVEVSSCGIT
jgi:hypothetical protein